MRTRTIVVALTLTVALPGAFLAHASPGDLLGGIPLPVGGEPEEPTNGTHNDTGHPGGGQPPGGRPPRDNATGGNSTHGGNATGPRGHGGHGSNSTGGNSTGSPYADEGAELPVAFVACQDVDGDGACGGEGEPKVAACGDDADLGGFVRGALTRVVVETRPLTACGAGTPVAFAFTY